MKRTVGGEAAQRQLITASRMKIRLSRLIANSTAGCVIGVLTRNKIRHHGIRFDVRSKDFTPLVKAQLFWGAYEGTETRMIRSLLRESSTVIELGSSLGITSAHIADVMAPGGHLVCVEANPNLLPGLRERLNRHGTKIRVDVIHAAITDHRGVANLAIAPETVDSRVADPRPHDIEVQVPALTLADVLHGTGVTEFDLVSDIEGAEAAFLWQDPGVLSRCRRAVIELHDATADGRNLSIFDLIDSATSAGFRIASCYGPVVSLIR